MDFSQIQKELDRTDLPVGHRFDHGGKAVIGNGTPDEPLLMNVGVDRLGRIWGDDGDALTLLNVGPLPEAKP